MGVIGRTISCCHLHRLPSSFVLSPVIVRAVSHCRSCCLPLSFAPSSCHCCVVVGLLLGSWVVVGSSSHHLPATCPHVSSFAFVRAHSCLPHAHVIVVSSSHHHVVIVLLCHCQVIVRSSPAFVRAHPRSPHLQVWGWAWGLPRTVHVISVMKYENTYLFHGMEYPFPGPSKWW
jgi:hypothetical protein